ncbi:CheY-P-specific phosphatase CheC [Ammoniphilus oxalaticus]|uniref:CheY-P-specific phosphatase CheC n=1 Tax=Ammoniphilus oxalaticus TaxID=66863 RepID=A0A419SJZ2_9BACL|nr:chemotaxis protein CheC [Ammoniphilus oxalaticus]RKD24256.1 CheY-P-specific phosphatase CheC [Ammoniphilus oxalaticus]
MKRTKNIFGELQLDVLREIGNIGSGHATTALAQLTGKPIEMMAPTARILDFNEVANLAGGPEAVVVTVYLRVIGDLKGSMFFTLSDDLAKQLLETLLASSPVENKFSEMEISALNEIGNILIGSYLSALVDLTQLNAQPSVPSLAVDMAGAILSIGLIELSQTSDFAIAIDTSFLDGQKALEGHFFFMPDPHSIEKVFTSLGVPFDECS